MIAIADSGSTKTDWVVTDNQGVEIFRLQMEGLNPYHVSDLAMAELTQSAFADFKEIDKIKDVFFYGAGCSNEERKEEVDRGISNIFPKARIYVESDILGAARALFQNNKGMAIILGTGSNTVIYDGKKVVRGIKSLGYILGDEGSGSYLGKSILQAYLHGEFDEELASDFQKSFNLDHSYLLENLYKKNAPNRYLASFAKFAYRKKNHPLIQAILRKNFEDYFQYQLSTLTPDKDFPLGVVGSIGYFFQEIISKVAKNRGYHIEMFLQRPIEGLIKFHCNEL